MTRHVSPNVVHAFYQAYASRDAERVAPLIADQVRWTIVGPSQILPFCGEHHGKAAVLRLFTETMPKAIKFRSFEPEVLVIDGDRAAAFVKLSGYLRNTGRIITYHCGQFVRFENDKVACFRAVIDSFDAAEQALGHQIDPLHEPVRHAPIDPDSAVIAI